ALAIGIGVGAVSAALVGYLCVQRSGLYFIMLTFALNQMFYFTAYQWTTVTGGEDGMPGVPRPNLLALHIHGPLGYYAAAAAPVPRLALDHEAHRRVAARQDPPAHPRERAARRGPRLQRAAHEALRLRGRRRLLGTGGGALRHALRHRPARVDRVRVLRQRR